MCRYLSLSDNKKSDLKARELKSVTLDQEAVLLRFVLHQCHINDLNLFSQVLSPCAGVLFCQYCMGACAAGTSQGLYS